MNEEMPPPPTQPNTFGESQPPSRVVLPAADDLRGVNIVAGVVAAAIVLFKLLDGIGSGLGVAYAIGGCVGTLLVPVALGAFIGWGNQKRARITFIIVGCLFLVSTMAQAGGA